MKNYSLGKSELQSSRLIYGCMRISGDQSVNAIDKGKRAVQSAIDAGYNHFDHADIYGGGASEQLFGELLKQLPHLREKMILTSKASIRPKNNENTYAPTRYDFSKAYLLSSVEGSLKRLHTEQLDLFLLHRPDYLFDINEVAETFKELKDSGKVAHFGVSNFKPSQVAMLQSALDLPLLVNQIEINIHNVDALNDGTLDQCQQDKLSPIAWCPLGGVAYSAWGNTFSVEDEQRIAEELTSQAQVYNCQPWQIILAWLLKHPAKIFPIIGSTTPERIIAAKVALELNYSREDWYRLFEARNGKAVP
ncbi:aldo/keto reductase family oxidoreductase [Colwellia sp. MB3u-55]|jgi:predicted oxidoreductase|uniref:aldo/keto reductase n=1 Tax=Colwellia sp. MB3u-55 TaxID=2759810 RepID=UPI0015F364DA|nr:aldo/keto reductase [Colwellia sp. MB3u-55]MBA6252214.1 aldo/keto reductase [Colwellia sp. MB3u-55]